MKQERAFSKGGFYTFVLESNLMLHKNVAAKGRERLEQWLKDKPSNQPIHILDLACGGAPVSLCNMIAGFTDRVFHYTGVDINPDQVEAAKAAFTFPANCKQISVYEGNAWDFASLPLQPQYDLIFTGMNLHHGTPEEIYCLLAQTKARLAPGGLFLNHDFYRPSEASYLRRPEVNPANANESYAMVPAATLAVYPCAFKVKERESTDSSDWREPFVNRYMRALRDLGAEESGVQEIATHVLNRDFPVSIPEMRSIADKAGFRLTVLDLAAHDALLPDSFFLVEASVA